MGIPTGLRLRPLREVITEEGDAALRAVYDGGGGAEDERGTSSIVPTSPITNAGLIISLASLGELGVRFSPSSEAVLPFPLLLS
jgi:hypothetical protein